jgi:hypothetical protein
MAILRGHHFLHRVKERVSGDLARRALTLYYDRALVRYILARVPRDRRATRFALALHGDAAPACVIATLDGHVVTCLARGMSTARAQLVYHWIIAKLIREYDDYAFASTLASTRRGGCGRVLPSSTCPAITPNRSAIPASETP